VSFSPSLRSDLGDLDDEEDEEDQHSSLGSAHAGPAIISPPVQEAIVSSHFDPFSTRRPPWDDNGFGLSKRRGESSAAVATLDKRIRR